MEAQPQAKLLRIRLWGYPRRETLVTSIACMSQCQQSQEPGLQSSYLLHSDCSWKISIKCSYFQSDNQTVAVWGCREDGRPRSWVTCVWRSTSLMPQVRENTRTLMSAQDSVWPAGEVRKTASPRAEVGGGEVRVVVSRFASGR